MNIRPLLIAHTQAAKLAEPGKGPLHYPPTSAQPTSMFSISLGEQRRDVPDTQTLPDCLRAITTVAQHAIRTMARSSSLSLQEWDSINECECLLRVVTIRAGELDGEWNTATVADQMPFAAQLRPVGGVGTCLKPPKTARIEQLSSTARDQSICP